MPTFEDTVIATGRDTFWRLDGLDDVHPLLVDKSGNSRDATCYEPGSDGHVHGVFSPIESDAGSFAMSGRVGHWTDTVNRLNTFTWFAFGYSAPSTHPKTLLARSGQWALSGSCIMGFNSSGTSVLGRLKVGGVSYALSAPCVPSTYYFVALRYNAGVIDLLLNAVVVDTSGPSVTGDMEVGSSTEFRLGSDFSIIITTEPCLGVDEIATGPTLNDAELLTIYESALNATLLSGVSNVIPSAILYSDIEPDPISFPFRHNWTDSLIERISFRTGRSVAVKGYESNNQQRPKPRRELEISQVLRDNDERQSFRDKLTANQQRKWFIPILEDREQLTTQLVAGSTLMPADTQYRDYEVGSYVDLRQLSVTGEVTKAEQVLITALSPLTTTPIVNTYDAYLSSISPARRGILEAQVSPRGHTDAVEDMTLVVRLIAEDEQVIPNRITAWTPTLTYKSYEVYDPATWQSNDWSELRDYNVERERADIDFDIGSFSVESDAIAASESFSYRMLLEGRDKQAALLGWFYARAGSGNYLWVPTMQRDFTIVSAASANLTVTKHNYFDNFAGSEYRRDLAFVYHNNTMIFRRINSVALSGANEVLTLNTTVPTQTNLRSVSYLRFCRMDGDTMEIARATDTKAQFAWSFREILSSPA